MKQRKHRFERRGRGEDRLLRDDKNCNYANWLRNIGIYVSKETLYVTQARANFFPLHRCFEERLIIFSSPSLKHRFFSIEEQTFNLED